MNTKPNITETTISAELAEIKTRIAELIQARGMHSFSAVVEKDKAAIQEVERINGEIRRLSDRESILEPALAETVKRAAAAAEQAAAEARRQNAREAETLCHEAEVIAGRLDQALDAVRIHALEYETTMIRIRRLTGFGPGFELVRVFLHRSLRTAVHRGPIHLDAIAPSEMTTATKASASWIRNIQTRISMILDTKTAAKEAA